MNIIISILQCAEDGAGKWQIYEEEFTSPNTLSEAKIWMPLGEKIYRWRRLSEQQKKRHWKKNMKLERSFFFHLCVCIYTYIYMDSTMCVHVFGCVHTAWCTETRICLLLLRREWPEIFSQGSNICFKEPGTEVRKATLCCNDMLFHGLKEKVLFRRHRDLQYTPFTQPFIVINF